MSSAPIQFAPKHAQPFTLEEAMELEVETLIAEVNRLRNSISHLRRTQAELNDYLNSEDGLADPEERGGQGDGEVTKAVRENEGVIQSQTERIALITVALSNKLGGDTRLEHYGLSLGGGGSAAVVAGGARLGNDGGGYTRLENTTGTTDTSGPDVGPERQQGSQGGEGQSEGDGGLHL